MCPRPALPAGSTSSSWRSSCRAMDCAVAGKDGSTTRRHQLACAGRALHLPEAAPWGEWAARDERIRAAVAHGPEPLRGLGELLSAGDLYDDVLVEAACLAEPALESLPAARRAAADPSSGEYWRG